jgi:hypothetical protein
MGRARKLAVFGGIVLVLAGLLVGGIQALLATQLPEFWGVNTLLGVGVAVVMLATGTVTIARPDYGVAASVVGTAGSGLALVGSIAGLMGGFVLGMGIGVVGGLLGAVGSHRYANRTEQGTRPQADDGAASTD